MLKNITNINNLMKKYKVFGIKITPKKSILEIKGKMIYLIDITNPKILQISTRKRKKGLLLFCDINKGEFLEIHFNIYSLKLEKYISFYEWESFKNDYYKYYENINNIKI
jgi:hypothetical protein